VFHAWDARICEKYLDMRFLMYYDALVSRRVAAQTNTELTDPFCESETKAIRTAGSTAERGMFPALLMVARRVFAQQAAPVRGVYELAA
jgi:hypothetical protein